MIENGPACHAGRAETGVAAVGFYLFCLSQHGCCLIRAEKLFGLFGGEKGNDLVDGLNILLEFPDQFFRSGVFVFFPTASR